LSLAPPGCATKRDTGIQEIEKKSYCSARSSHLRGELPKIWPNLRKFIAGLGVLINRRLPFHYFSSDSTVDCCIWKFRLLRLFSTLQNANRTRKKNASDNLPQLIISEWAAKNRCSARYRRVFFFLNYFSSDFCFEGWKIILKVWLFLCSNPRFNPVKNNKIASDGLTELLSQQWISSDWVTLARERPLRPLQ